MTFTLLPNVIILGRLQAIVIQIAQEQELVFEELIYFSLNGTLLQLFANPISHNTCLVLFLPCILLFVNDYYDLF